MSVDPQSQSPEAEPRLRDRLFGLRALVAVAVAGVLLGGFAGVGIQAATADDGGNAGFGPGRGGFPGGPGQPGPPPN